MFMSLMGPANDPIRSNPPVRGKFFQLPAYALQVLCESDSKQNWYLENSHFSENPYPNLRSDSQQHASMA
jgi:hypothetical protein